jgi:pimeloyl-ACP methyl ester carboxylesterase
MEPLILLHGALGAATQLEALMAALSHQYEIHSFNFSGHGGRELPADGIQMEDLSNELVQWISDKGLIKPHVFGYSMGGYAAMLACKQHPGLLGKLATLATKWHWDMATAAKETKMLQPDIVAAKVPAFAASLAQRHAPTDWKALMKATADMMCQLGEAPPLQAADFTTIDIPCLLLLGDRDKMVSWEETNAVYQQLPKAHMAVLPGTPHPLEQVDVTLLAYMLQRFFG